MTHTPTVDQITFTQTHVVTFTTNDLEAVEALQNVANATGIDCKVEVLKHNQGDLILSIIDGIANGSIAYATPKEIAAAIGASEGRVSQVKRGNLSHPSVKRYDEIADTLKVQEAAARKIEEAKALLVKHPELIALLQQVQGSDPVAIEAVGQQAIESVPTPKPTRTRKPRTPAAIESDVA